VTPLQKTPLDLISDTLFGEERQGGSTLARRVVGLFLAGLLQTTASLVFVKVVHLPHSGPFAVFLAAAGLSGRFDGLLDENRRAIYEQQMSTVTLFEGAAGQLDEGPSRCCSDTSTDGALTLRARSTKPRALTALARQGHKQRRPLWTTRARLGGSSCPQGAWGKRPRSGQLRRGLVGVGRVTVGGVKTSRNSFSSRGGPCSREACVISRSLHSPIITR
jgi:hypothetical protein